MANKKPKDRKLPKGAYPLPNGDYVTEHLEPADAKGRRLKVTAVHRAEPDAKALARIFFELGSSTSRRGK